jgi:predicted Rossmann-fold nucleotide-binding protein
LILNVDHFWDPLCALFDQMKRLEFIRAGLTINLLVADRAEDILPKLREAARVVAEPQKEMTPAAAERM